MLRGLSSGCSLETVCDMVTMAIEVAAFRRYWSFFILTLLCRRVLVSGFLRAQRAVSAQCPLDGVTRTVRCQSHQGWGEQPVFPIAFPVPQFVSSEELGVLTKPTCSPLADQAKRQWGWFRKVVRLTEKVSKSWKFPQLFCHRLCKKPQSVVDSTGSGCLCGVNQ